MDTNLNGDDLEYYEPEFTCDECGHYGDGPGQVCDCPCCNEPDYSDEPEGPDHDSLAKAEYHHEKYGDPL